MVARYLKAVGDPREVVRDPEARYSGGRVEEHSTLVPLGEAQAGPTSSVSTNGSAAHRQEPDPRIRLPKDRGLGPHDAMVL